MGEGSQAASSSFSNAIVPYPTPAYSREELIGMHSVLSTNELCVIIADMDAMIHAQSHNFDVCVRLYKDRKRTLKEAKRLCAARRHPLARKTMNDRRNGRKQRYCSVCRVHIYIYKKRG
jgi:hypothetical protein